MNELGGKIPERWRFSQGFMNSGEIVDVGYKITIKRLVLISANLFHTALLKTRNLGNSLALQTLQKQSFLSFAGTLVSGDQWNRLPWRGDFQTGLHHTKY